MEIYLIRHTKVNLPSGICYGFSDVDITETFESEAKAILAKINLEKPHRIFSSPLVRCQKLARFMDSKDVIIDERLKEMNFGLWELKKWDEIDRLDFEIWSKNYDVNKCPDGESFADLYERASSFYNSIISNDKDTIIVTHAGIIISILAYILEIPLKNAHKIKIDLASVSKITINKKLTTIDFINQR